MVHNGPMSPTRANHLPIPAQGHTHPHSSLPPLQGKYSLNCPRLLALQGEGVEAEGRGAPRSSNPAGVYICVFARGCGTHPGDVAVGPRALELSLPPRTTKTARNTRSLAEFPKNANCTQNTSMRGHIRLPGLLLCVCVGGGGMCVKGKIKTKRIAPALDP